MTLAILLSMLLGSSFAAVTLNPPCCKSIPSHPHIPSGHCTDYNITFPLTSENYVWAARPFKDNFDLQDWPFNSSRKDSRMVWKPFLDETEKVTKDYTISATFCTPKRTKDGKETTVLLATSGLGYDGRYWASSYKVEEYSFVEHVLKAGYSVIFYDRIGTGKSQKESGYVAQSSQAISLIRNLASSIKSGTYTGAIKSKKLVLVGHSFGSFTSNAAIALEPDLADGIILTGLSYPNFTLDTGAASQGWGPAAFASRIASTVNPPLYPSTIYDTGYVIFADIFSHVLTFFRTYEKDVAEYAHTIAQPLSVAELQSLGTLNLDARLYKGKVFITTGENDLLACGGECKSTYATGTQNTTWMGASALETYVHPGAGHGVNFNRNAPVFYGKIVSFLDNNF